MKNTFNFGDSCIKSMLIKFSSRSSLVNNPSSHGSLDLQIKFRILTLIKSNSNILNDNFF